MQSQFLSQKEESGISYRKFFNVCVVLCVKGNKGRKTEKSIIFCTDGTFKKGQKKTAEHQLMKLKAGVMIRSL